MPRYEEPIEGEWVQPVRKGYKMACCDCGLVHTLDFRVRKGRAQFRVFRNNRSTAQVRRWMPRGGYQGSTPKKLIKVPDSRGASANRRFSRGEKRYV